MATLKQIQTKMKQLQAQADVLVAKQSKSVLADIRKLMEQHGLTAADIDAHSDTKRRVGRPAGAQTSATTPASTKGKLPPKYRHPKTGATWSGHARPPAWIAKVRDRTKFLIDGAGAESDTNGVSQPKSKTAIKKNSSIARAAASKTQGQAKLPPKYRHPKTGATWSGHARTPAWIAKARDRTKFLIDGAEVADQPATATTTPPKKAAKTAATKETAARNTSAKKTTTKSAAATKTATKKAATTKTATTKAATRKPVAKKAASTAGTASAKKATAKRTASKFAVSAKKRAASPKAAAPVVKKTAPKAAKKVAPRKAVGRKPEAVETTVPPSELMAAPASSPASDAPSEPATV
ncbi:histone family protein nucleoid-structuring protein H-NS [Caballeronia terrestris]|uniref:Histone family protein nucleoid-structuring protein H-NS n=1 Tax=Caballeronia terrestris TaxID=1226301 RepID=A0A158KCZ1_9BURK|nr:H-NS histone family protein [Caballeronia terrestris]SAL78659.1 histone family protein nucleoid-structuring protein H-NS [Caballeronia terrestris]